MKVAHLFASGVSQGDNWFIDIPLSNGQVVRLHMPFAGFVALMQSMQACIAESQRLRVEAELRRN